METAPISVRKKFDDTWLLEYDVGGLCRVRDCHVKITEQLIKHFVWFENSQISASPTANSTGDHLKKIILPLNLIWFEDQAEKFMVETATARMNYSSEEVEEEEDGDVSDSPEVVFSERRERGHLTGDDVLHSENTT